MFNIDNKNNRATSMTSSSVFNVNVEHISHLNFEQVNVSW